MKKTLFVIALATALVFAFAGAALANFGPHGGYAQDTDSCAGCHRAHSSFSQVTWTATNSLGNSSQHSALLVSSASTMLQFCYACHGEGVPGASTNVQMGVFDSGPSGADGVTAGMAYQTNSSYLGVLNGGGFESVGYGAGTGVTSMHDMGKGAATDPMWGAGASAPAGADLTCTGCHDPHGSSNYRLLKDQVNGGTPEGGYTAADVPQPYVFSSEEGYPSGGWRKHDAGAADMVAYRPNYTNEEYAFMGSAGYSGGKDRSISTWCAGCHETYDESQGNQTYNGFEAVGTHRNGVSAGNSGTLVAGGGTDPGTRWRHRHPVNVSPSTVTAANGWGTDAVTSTALPLEKRPTADYDAERGTTDIQDILGCLTCHRAHGTSATMTGWAEASLVTSASAITSWYPQMSTQPTISGVNPNFTSALLRVNNRGVCERCHNK